MLETNTTDSPKRLIADLLCLGNPSGLVTFRKRGSVANQPVNEVASEPIDELGGS